MDMELVNQQIADQARGEDVLRERHRTDQSLRQTFQQNFHRQLTPQERHILDSPPTYTQAEIDADAIVLKFKCPILQTIPELDDIVKFHGHYYSFEALKDLRSRPPPPTRDGSPPVYRNPVTNLSMTEAQFKSGELPLSTTQKSRLSTMISDYEARSFRRAEWEAYNALKTRLANLQTVTNGRQQTINAVGQLQASPIENYINREREHNSATLALLGRNARQNENSVQIQSPQQLAHFGDTREDSDVDLDHNSPIRPRAQLTYATRDRSNSTGTQASTLQSQQEDSEEENDDANNQDNPLDESAVVVFPTKLWGNPRAEQALKSLLQLAKDQGWETTLFRNRTKWCDTIADTIFKPGGCLFGFRSVKGNQLLQRFRNAFNHHASLSNNHSGDTTGAAGETSYLWTPLYEEYLQWKDSHNTANQAQQSRQSMRTVQNALGAVQPPLGPGNPAQRSEVAAENGPSVPGPQEIGADMEVRQVPAANATQPVVRPQMQARSSRGRRRSNNNPSGTQRNNRQRTDRGSTIQDHIDQGRQHLDTIT